MLHLMLMTLLAAPAGIDDLIDVAKIDTRWVIDIRYATADNFTKTKLYPVARCVLRKEVAEMLNAAQKYLDAHHKKNFLMLKDCYRPERVQFLMWEVVKNTPMQGYVADPNSQNGSVHNYGAAVDLTLVDENGKELDMGTEYDHLGPLAEPRLEEKYLAEKKLNQMQIANRHLLRDAMVEGGHFKAISNEWWHFDALQGGELRKKFRKLDVPLQDIP